MNFPNEWTGDAVKRMHLNDIKQSEIAEVMGVSREIVCKTLSGKYQMKDGEARINAAIDFVIENRNQNACKGSQTNA